MKAVLLDTHAWAWSFLDRKRLSPRSLRAFAEAEAVFVSPISFFEIARKVRIGKWPQMAAFVQDMANLLERQGGTIADVDPTVCIRAGAMDWAHRDPFDRLIAATALRRDLPLISADAVFDGVVNRLW